MNADILFERDMLYPTSNGIEFGSIHIQVFSPDKNARVPLVIESKYGHLPEKSIDTIVRIMQSDIFDRVYIDIKKNIDIYIKVDPEQSGEYSNHSHIKVHFTGNDIECEGVNR